MHGFHESGRPKIGWAPEFTIPGMHVLMRHEFAFSKITFGIFEEIGRKTIVTGLVMLQTKVMRLIRERVQKIVLFVVMRAKRYCCSWRNLCSSYKTCSPRSSA